MTRHEPVYLTTLRELCREMRVSAATIRKWVHQNAPIGVEVRSDGKCRYCAEKHELMAWRTSAGNIMSPEQGNMRLPG